ncbi:MAG: hypothetical protein HOK21_20835 [Rhodospirillaceae bacterium]|jgi:hypothetical protein|nr:hypothetical protein [Rhodospirillaceae bacterium]MBT5080593.1 hypothetical protein [Rhodospirillaceae bacterium]MBT5526538.1 hypothetical protein [Rhodospirillaceae bacterium]
MNELGPLVDTIAKLEPWRGTCTEGSFANFLGVMTDLEYVARHHPSNIEQSNGESTTVVHPPKVTDGETFFEFAAINKAILEAKERFVMLELGGGYAARSVDAHRLLQTLNPMPCQLVIVEAEPTHFHWAKCHMAANGIDPQDHWLINAAVSTDCHPKMFMHGAGLFYNSFVDPRDVDEIVAEIVKIDGTEQVVRNLMIGGRCGIQMPYKSAAGQDLFDYSFVSTLSLTDILTPLPLVDLIDMDIQGAEDVVIAPAIEMLNRRVKRLHIGTHGGDVHRGLWDLFFEHEWICEFDYSPNSQHDTPWGPFETMDGILHLKNSRL